MKRLDWRNLLAFVLIAAVFSAGIYKLNSDKVDSAARAQVAAGAQAHRALCVFKHDLAKRAADGRAFLRLTPAERVAKYGPALGTIPAATIRSSVKNQTATLDSLKILDC